jgi:GntR family transcriptional regulator
MRDSGHEASQRLLTSAQEQRPEIARALRTRGRVRRYELLRYVDGMPWTLSTTWVPEHRFRGLDRHWAGEDSLYEVLEREFGVRMRRSHRTIRTEASGPADAEHLMVPVGFALLVMEGLNVDENGKPVALVEHRGRGDRVQFTVRLNRDP